MMTRLRMANPTVLISSTLLVVGVGLVLLGFNRALDSTAGGLLASIAAVAALLYAGAVWLGPRLPPRRGMGSSLPELVVFDRRGIVVSGPGLGGPVSALFPEASRGEIDRRAVAAIAGATARFTCAYENRTMLFDAVPVRSTDGTVLYGILLSAEHTPAHA